jgi:hypothetical protein
LSFPPDEAMRKRAHTDHRFSPQVGPWSMARQSGAPWAPVACAWSDTDEAPLWLKRGVVGAPDGCAVHPGSPVRLFVLLRPGARWLHGTSRGGGRSRLRCRTESPQPVSSVRRRWSTDAMQLREVGKPAAYLWKMRWLQTPGGWARHPVLCGPARQVMCPTHVSLPVRALDVHGGGLGPPHPQPVASSELLLCGGIRLFN